MEWLQDILRNMMIMVFLTMVLDWLLPEGSMREYVKIAMGLFVVLTLLQPILQIRSSENWLTAWQLSFQQGAAVAIAPVEGLTYEETIQKIDQQYAEKINEQVESLLQLMGSWKEIKVVSEVQQQVLEHMTIIMPDTSVRERKNVQEALCRYYGLEETQVQIREE